MDIYIYIYNSFKRVVDILVIEVILTEVILIKFPSFRGIRVLSFCCNIFRFLFWFNQILYLAVAILYCFDPELISFFMVLYLYQVDCNKSSILDQFLEETLGESNQSQPAFNQPKAPTFDCAISPKLYLQNDFATCSFYNHFYQINDDMANKIDDMTYS